MANFVQIGTDCFDLEDVCKYVAGGNDDPARAHLLVHTRDGGQRTYHGERAVRLHHRLRDALAPSVWEESEEGKEFGDPAVRPGGDREPFDSANALRGGVGDEPGHVAPGLSLRDLLAELARLPEEVLSAGVQTWWRGGSAAVQRVRVVGEPEARPVVVLDATDRGR